MKKTVFSLLLLGAVFAFSSCEGVIHDWTTSYLYLTIFDEDGTNLLDSLSEGYLLAAGDAVVSFPEGYHVQPTVVKVSDSDSSSETRTFCEPWYGGVITTNPEGVACIRMGAFNEGTDTEVTLTFADGSEIVVSVYHCARLSIGGERLVSKESVVSAPKHWKVKAKLLWY